MPTNINKIRTVTIENVIEETPSVRTLEFKDVPGTASKAGQFLMVWIPRVEELPMSVMVSNKKGYAAVTVRRHGIGSTALYNKNVGDIIGVRGPYGNSFEIGNNKNVMLVGGGTGLVPLLRLAVQLNKAKVKTILIIGARTSNEVLFEKRAASMLSGTEHKILVSTEDGSYGLKGYPTDLLLQQIKENRLDTIYTCGPELMMKKVAQIALNNNISVQASLERYMKCGIGICASCCIGDQLVCKDGTVFNSTQISTLTEFGTAYRDKSGRKVRY